MWCWHHTGLVHVLVCEAMWWRWFDSCLLTLRNGENSTLLFTVISMRKYHYTVAPLATNSSVCLFLEFSKHGSQHSGDSAGEGHRFEVSFTLKVERMALSKSVGKVDTHLFMTHYVTGPAGTWPLCWVPWICRTINYYALFQEQNTPGKEHFIFSSITFSFGLDYLA